MGDYRSFFKGKRIVITGGLGFLGSNLTLKLVSLGARVVIIDNLLEPYGGNRFNISSVAEGVEVHEVDVRDRDGLNPLLWDSDVVYHIAAQTSHVDSMYEPYLDIDINYNGTINILESCKAQLSGSKIVYIGTRAQYGSMAGKAIVDETATPNPTDLYSVSKQAAEQAGLVYSKAHGINFTSLRITNGYGPRHQMKHSKYGIINWFIRLALDNATIKLFGDGSQLRDILYVDDICDAMLRAGASSTSSGEVYNVCSGSGMAFGDIARKIIEVAGTGTIESVPWPSDRKAIETGDFVASNEKILRDLGWKPSVGIEEGLKQTIDYFKQHKGNYWA